MKHSSNDSEAETELSKDLLVMPAILGRGGWTGGGTCCPCYPCYLCGLWSKTTADPAGPDPGPLSSGNRKHRVTSYIFDLEGGLGIPEFSKWFQNILSAQSRQCTGNPPDLPRG